MIETKYRPLLGITIGDPSGIGPEIILKALDEEGIYEICKPVVLGPEEVLIRAGKVIGKEALIFTRLRIRKTVFTKKERLILLNRESMIWKRWYGEKNRHWQDRLQLIQ